MRQSVIHALAPKSSLTSGISEALANWNKTMQLAKISRR
jgi:hypothetical protein